MTWGDADRLLTVERDRAIVWDVTTGAAVASVPLPHDVVGVERVAATANLERAAALVGVQRGEVYSDELLSIDFASSEATLFGVRSGQGSPFAFSEDGDSLIVGSELWDTGDWSLRDAKAESFSPSGKREPHPRREAAASKRPGTLTLSLLPVSGPRLWQRLLAFGPRKLEFLEGTLDVASTGEAASFHPVPGRVSISTFDGAPEVHFDVPDPDALLVVSPSGRWVGTLANEFTLRSATSAEPLGRLEGTRWASRGLLSDDGKVLVLGYAHVEALVEQVSAKPGAPTPAELQRLEQRLEAWDLASGELLYRSSARLQKDARLSPDGRYLWGPSSNDVVDLRARVLRSFDRPLRLVSNAGIGVLRDEWGGTTLVDLATGRAVLAPERRAKVLAASNDGRHFATLSPDWSLQLETPHACARIKEPPPVGQPSSTNISFTVDSSTLLVGSYGNLRSVAWDTRTARPLAKAQDGRRGARSAGTSEFFVASVEDTVTATAASPDRAFTVSANLRGDLTLTRANGASVSGRAHFAQRHDHVIGAWFPGANRVAVQTARGGVFEFLIDT
jgi:hypothetical protein